MSIIVYGPKGCGKTRRADELRQKFGLDRIVDERDPLHGGKMGNPYEFAVLHPERFKSEKVLYLTNIDPPEGVVESGTRRVMSFADAVQVLCD